MIADDDEVARWDGTNRRFQEPLRCPYPDCGQRVQPSFENHPVLAWCASCQRPYESVRHRPDPNAEPIELMRRPRAAFCTFTGQKLPGFSLLDWAEEGGGPGRTHCLADELGVVFGLPSVNKRIVFEEAWARESILDQVDSMDFVSSVSVVRGQLVAVTARGRVGAFDALTGEPRLPRPLDWPDRSTHPSDAYRHVRRAPAFRGTHMLVAAPHQAQFHDLRSFLLGSGESAQRPLLVDADRGVLFLGPPLGLDVGERSAFCLLQGEERPRDAAQYVLRVFDLDGHELARQPTGPISRPPVFDRRSGFIVWVDPQGTVAAVPGETLLAGTATERTFSRPDRLLQVEPAFRPTLVAAPDTQGLTELWIGTDSDGVTLLCHTLLSERLEAPAKSWSWDQRNVGRLGPLTGLAVGIGSRSHQNAAGQQIAVATGQQAARLERASQSSDTNPMQGSGSNPGSFDAPLLCSAGAIARVQGKLCLDNQGMGWKPDEFQQEIALPGVYKDPQGLAMFGRHVFMGDGSGVRCYRLRVEEQA